MSKIARVEVHEFEFPMQDMGRAHAGFDLVYKPGVTTRIPKYALVIETADGARGEYAAQWGATKFSLAQTLDFLPHLLGRDPSRRGEILHDFRSAAKSYEHTGYGVIDICLWDLTGKLLNTSVATLLGGWKTKLPAYASTHVGDRNGGLSSPEAYADFAQQCYELGYRAFKTHGWADGNAEEEASIIDTLGKRLGDKMKFAADPACVLQTFLDTLVVGRACDRNNFLWLEDPMRELGRSQFAHRKLKEHIKTPLLATELVHALEPKADFLLAGATDLLRADPEFDSGITGVMKVASFAELLGIDVEIHACGPAHRHCMAAIRNTNFYEVALVGPRCGNPLPNVYASDYSDQLDCVDASGCVEVPTGAGLGVAYDWQFIERYRTQRHTFE